MRTLLCLFMFLPVLVQAQNHDYHWAFGYGYYLPADTSSVAGTCLVDFNERPPKFTKTNLKLRFDDHTAICSDSLGQLLFYTNGLRIFNKDRKLITNGDTLNPGAQWQNAVEDSAGYLGFAPLVLPDPAGGNRYYLIHTGIYVSNGVKFGPLYFTLIDMAANNGRGQVLLKNQVLAQGDFSEAVAAKHANGRDWWIIVNVADQARFLRYLVTPEGISTEPEQVVEGLEFTIPSGSNRARMSYDAQHYAFVSGNNFTVLYDFDRCSGFLSNQRILLHNPNFFYSALSFSPDSRFLYLNTTRTIAQYDLLADTLSGLRLDTVQKYDYNVYPFELFRTTYAEPSIGADGKIYYTPFSTTRYMHLMHRPYLPGSACDMENGGVFLPRYIGYTYFHYPNYRLGKLEGSPCDTLANKGAPPAGFEEPDRYEDFLEQKAHSSRQVFRQASVPQQPAPVQTPWDEFSLKQITEKRLKARRAKPIPKSDTP